MLTIRSLFLLDAILFLVVKQKRFPPFYSELFIRWLLTSISPCIYRGTDVLSGPEFPEKRSVKKLHARPRPGAGVDLEREREMTLAIRGRMATPSLDF
jgi:hypothetical protein